MASPVYADLVRPVRPGLARVFDAALVAGFSLVIALGAQIAIPLGFTPVPVTLQTLAVLMAGCLLGSSRGALAVIAYVTEGCAGLPVFSGGTGGISHLLGPTGGYLVGFVAAAYLVGLLAESGLPEKRLGSLVTLAIGSIVLYIPGLVWLGFYTGFDKVLALGFIPFVVGDTLKLAAGWGLLSGAALLTARARGRRR